MKRDIIITYQLNSGELTKTGTVQGYCQLNDGYLSGSIDRKTSHEITHGDFILLSCFTYTGCPIASKSIECDSEEVNPWRWTKGAYHSTRTLETPYGLVKSTLESTPKEDAIYMHLNIDSPQDFSDKLVGIAAPFQETISQTKTIGKLEGRFTVSFIGKEVNFEGKATSDYRLNISKPAPKSVWRNITILDHESDQRYTQEEHIQLFDDQQIANNALKEIKKPH